MVFAVLQIFHFESNQETDHTMHHIPDAIYHRCCRHLSYDIFFDVVDWFCAFSVPFAKLLGLRPPRSKTPSLDNRMMFQLNFATSVISVDPTGWSVCSSECHSQERSKPAHGTGNAC